MNDNRYYSNYDGRYIGGCCRQQPRRTMKEVKADFNNHLRNYTKSKVKQIKIC